MDKKDAKGMLKKINEKTNQNWDFDKIKSLAKGFSPEDMKSDKKLKSLIKKVGKSLGVNLNNKKIEKVQEKVKKKFK
ncbi:stage VI sporulation protein F [Ammoniphilus oxalaticus]|uniref:stage VI sporulation protein F n=1 Tax=Ammoniphilus oxalaticus TaxID=66863 RepID=UPI001FE8B957|nr:stage VI sporulation protein F [Ammoniphilus oxalaticus]